MAGTLPGLGSNIHQLVRILAATIYVNWILTVVDYFDSFFQIWLYILQTIDGSYSYLNVWPDVCYREQRTHMTSRRQRIVPRSLPSGPQPRFWSRFFEELRVQLWVHLCLLFIFCLLSLVTTAQNQQKTTNELLHSSDAEQRRDAVLQLGASGKQEAIPFLIDVTQHDSSPEIRAIAASELGRMRATAALEVLTAALQDKDIFVRRTAAYSLGSIGDPTAAPALIRSLSDKEPAVRSAAAYSLGRIGNQTAVGPLI